jgi:hypothetical protein
MSQPRAPSNPSDAYPPTRPGALLVAIALLVIVAIIGIENWSDLAKEFPRIEAALRL